MGTLLQLVAMAGMAIAAYAKFDARLTTAENSISANQKERAKQSEILATIVNQQTRISTILDERSKAGKL